MLTSSGFKQSEKIELPEAESGTSKQERNITVSILPIGQVEYEGKTYSLDALIPILQLELNNNEKKIIEIKADKNITFELFGEVIEMAKKAGAEDFVLATEAIDESAK
jgi:biopolymer transport protein ExbD